MRGSTSVIGVFVVLACALCVSGINTRDAEAAVERPADGAKLVRATIFGNRKQAVNIVARGDMRASQPTAPIAVRETGFQNAALFNGLRGMGSRAEVKLPAKGVPNILPKKVAAPVRRAFGANYASNKCIDQGGQCQTTDTCGGLVTRNLCPGPSFITCCTYTSTACAAKGGSCKDTSTCLGEVVRGLCPGGNNIACCTSESGAGGKAAPQGGNCLANFNGAAFAARAIKYQTEYKKNGVRFDSVKRQFGASPPVAFADSASFVTSVLDSLSWNCLFAVGRNTAAMIPQMQVRGAFHTTPKIGDIAMWNTVTGIVVEECPAGAVRMVTVTPAAGAVDTGCISNDALKGFGEGVFLGFWTPY